MKKLLIFTITFIFLISGLKANSVVSSVKNTFEKLPLPFHVIKETAEKVSSFGLKKLLFGVTSATMISEYYSSLKKDEKDYSKNQIKFNKNLDYYITRLVNKIYEV